MHVHAKPPMPQMAPAPKPAKPAPVEDRYEVKAIAEQLRRDRRGGNGKGRQGEDRQAVDRDKEAPKAPASSFAMTLALLDLDRMS